MIPAKLILGIVAEYDPFHNGHAFHLNEARKIVRPDSVYTVISPCMKQRGELSMFSPHLRAECAVRAGADAVFSMPVLWTVRDAEHYAFGAVSLLCGLGITHLAFGAETPDPDLLAGIADFLENPPSAFTDALKLKLETGSGYPAALTESVSAFLPEAGPVLSAPNNILAVCYLRALKRQNSSVVPVMIPRRDTYHAAAVESSAPSASALRSALKRGNYSQVFHAMPPFSANLVRRAYINRAVPDLSVWDALLVDRLRFADLSALPGVSEGLDDAIRKAASCFSSAEELISALSSKRYTAARISRLCALAMLGVSEERLRKLPPPSATLLLALRKSKALTERWKDLPVRIWGSYSEWRNASDPEDLLVWRLWAECCGMPDTLPYKQQIYTE